MHTHIHAYTRVCVLIKIDHPIRGLYTLLWLLSRALVVVRNEQEILELTLGPAQGTFGFVGQALGDALPAVQVTTLGARRLLSRAHTQDAVLAFRVTVALALALAATLVVRLPIISVFPLTIKRSTHIVAAIAIKVQAPVEILPFPRLSSGSGQGS